MLRKYLKDRHITQQEFADKVGVSITLINLVINRNFYPKPKVASSIARHMRVKVINIFPDYHHVWCEKIRKKMKRLHRTWKKRKTKEQAKKLKRSGKSIR